MASEGISAASGKASYRQQTWARQRTLPQISPQSITLTEMTNNSAAMMYPTMLSGSASTLPMYCGCRLRSPGPLRP